MGKRLTKKNSERARTAVLSRFSVTVGAHCGFFFFSENAKGGKPRPGG